MLFCRFFSRFLDSDLSGVSCDVVRLHIVCYVKEESICIHLADAFIQGSLQVRIKEVSASSSI